MVSFFGLKFGDKKKKSDEKPAQDKEQQQSKRAEQNTHQPGVANGSIRSLSRAGNPQPGGLKSPYANHDTNSLAAASMCDLGSAGSGRRGSQASSLHPRPHASDLNLGNRFAANNGSAASLVAPGPPGPGTPNGRPKPRVNPLDAHPMRDTASGPQTPKSPLANSPVLPRTPVTENGESGSVFGEEADEMVNAVMSSVNRQEEEAKKTKEREKELEKQRETARLEMERLERQKSTGSGLTVKSPSATPSERETQQQSPNGSILQGPLFRGSVETRPSSRGGPGPNGPLRPSPLLTGPPPTGPPTQRLPQPPGQGPPRHGPLGPVPRPNGPGPHNPRTPGIPAGVKQPHGAGQQSPRPQGPPPKVFRPYRPPPPGQQGSATPSGIQSQDTAPKTPRTEKYCPQSPTSGDGTPGSRSAYSNPEREGDVGSGRNTPDSGRQAPIPLLSSLASPSTVTSPSSSVSGLSLDDEPMDYFSAPVIQDVAAKRDTQAFKMMPRQQSLSMKIEELEKTLIQAQQAHQAQVAQVQEADISSTGSSLYGDGDGDGDGILKDDEDDDGPILSIQPAPLRIPAAQAPAAPPENQPQSPFRLPPRRGLGPRRPALEEYGISSSAIRSRGPTPAPSSRSGSTDNYSVHSSPLSRTDTPQLRHPNWRRDPGQLSPAPTLDTADQPRPNPVVDTGFKFDFGPSAAAPPTPDSTTWPLSSPTNETASAPAPTSAPAPERPQAPFKSEPPGKFTRENVPPPLNLKFNFSPDAPSRDPTLGNHTGGLWTPTLRPAPSAAPGTDGRPSTSAGAGGGGGKLAASPQLISKFPESAPRDDDDIGAFMGIGMARGPSIRETRRPGASAASRGMVDSFGTGFI